MRFKGLLLCFLVCVGQLFGQTSPRQSAFYTDIHGPVKSIFERETKTGDDKTAHDQYFDREARFDEQGKLTEIATFREGELFSILRYQYLNDSLPVSATDFNADGSIYVSIHYQLDENGFVALESFDRSLQKRRDESRQPVDLEYYDYYTHLFTRIELKNDFLGRATEVHFFNENDELAHKLIHEYDFRGRLTSTKYYHTSGPVVWHTRYQYDTDGRLKIRKLFKNNYLAQSTKYEYNTDDHNNWIMRTATSKVVNNLFGQLLFEGTEVVQRSFIYY